MLNTWSWERRLSGLGLHDVVFIDGHVFHWQSIHIPESNQVGVLTCVYLEC